METRSEMNLAWTSHKHTGANVTVKKKQMLCIWNCGMHRLLNIHLYTFNCMCLSKCQCQNQENRQKTFLALHNFARSTQARLPHSPPDIRGFPHYGEWISRHPLSYRSSPQLRRWIPTVPRSFFSTVPLTDPQSPPNESPHSPWSSGVVGKPWRSIWTTRVNQLVHVHPFYFFIVCYFGSSVWFVRTAII